MPGTLSSANCDNSTHKTRFLRFCKMIYWSTEKQHLCPVSLFDGSVGCYTWTVDHFSQTVQQFFSVIIKVSIDFVDGLIFYYPQCAVSFSYQALIVRNYNYTCYKNTVNYITNCVLYTTCNLSLNPSTLCLT